LRTNTPRFAPQKQDEWNDEMRELFARMGHQSEDEIFNIFKTLAGYPKMFKRWLPFANHVLFKSSLSPRIREIAILRIGWLCRSEYEWTQHIRIGRDEADMNDADFKALEAGADDPHWNDEERAVVRAVDELHKDHFISDATWQDLSRHFSKEQMMDIVAAVGNYTLVSMMLNTFGVQLDDWLERYEGFPQG
jgi:4-carboxymuconolactone decarboxylase